VYNIGDIQLEQVVRCKESEARQIDQIAK